MKNLLGLLLIMTLASCATTTQFAKYNPDEHQKSSSEARIYILRPSILGSAVKMKVFCNEELVGKTGPKSYISWNVEEGEYTIRSSAENNDYFKIQAKAGQTYYIKQTPKMGWVMARVELESVGQMEGQRMVQQLKSPKVNYAE